MEMNYKSRKWQRARLAHLSREPLCRACGRAGEQVDHIKPVSRGGDMWDDDNLETLCASCHSQKTRIESSGGTWQVVGVDGYPVGGHWWNDDDGG